MITVFQKQMTVRPAVKRRYLPPLRIAPPSMRCVEEYRSQILLSLVFLEDSPIPPTLKHSGLISSRAIVVSRKFNPVRVGRPIHIQALIQNMRLYLPANGVECYIV